MVLRGWLCTNTQYRWYVLYYMSIWIKHITGEVEQDQMIHFTLKLSLEVSEW